MCPKYHCICSQILLVMFPNTTIFASDTTAFVQNNNIGQTLMCDNRILYFKIFVGQCETRAQRTNVKSHCGGRASSPTLPQCQLGGCQVHLFVVKFSSASALKNLTAKFTLCSFNSSPPKSIVKWTLSRSAHSADLKMDLVGIEPESVKSPSLQSATYLESVKSPSLKSAT